MLIKNEEVEKRLNNPLNLMNRMREGLKPKEKDALAIFTNRVEKNIPQEKEKIETSFLSGVKSINLPALSPPKVTSPLPDSFLSENINDVDAKVKLALAHDSALDLLTSSIDNLRSKISKGEVKASSIPSIITSASRVITDIRKERLERDKNLGNENIHFHFYCPEQRKMSEYEVIEVEG